MPNSSEYFKEYFKSLPPTRIVKGQILLRPGDPADKVFYVESGCLRSYIIDDKGKEHIYQFAPEDWVITDEEAMMDDKPSILFVDAVEDSIIKIMNRPVDLQTTDMTLEESRQLIQKLQKKVYVFRRRIIQLLSASAEERYSSFVSTYPNLVQRVPQKMIASYLGITPESLSRVRKQLVGKK